MNLRACALILLGGCLSGCSDPDIVPESHISAPPSAVSQPAVPVEVARDPLRTALFGDLHVHTSWSVDAYAGGNRLGPNSAYRFARGEAVELSNGVRAQLQTPLDFVALTDHSEGFDTHLACTIPGGPEFDLSQCRDMRSGDITQEDMLRSGFERGIPRPAKRDPVLCADVERCLANARITWQRVQDAANAYNEPGRFTALIGYEFSSLLSDFGMLHRNVIFRGTDVIAHAISSQDVTNQKDFFAQLDGACVEPCEVLTIPHNTNYSWGLTFSRTDEDGSAYGAEDLARRARIERLFEITQQKGTSECQLGVGAADEECTFGIMFPACEEGQDTKCIKPASMFRNVLLDGLALGVERDLNPYQTRRHRLHGHTQLRSGKHALKLPAQFARAEGSGFAAERVFELEHVVVGPVRRMSAGGLAGVWAESNTRADIFDALRRREAFATSGSRLRIRFFGGNLPADIGDRREPVALAYQAGVPMGSDLIGTEAPRFWVWASQDPAGPRLDRIQIIKGWIEDGEQHQSVWDVACSDGRVPGASGRCAETTAAVDPKTCKAIGAPGAGELQATFSDPGFVARQPAFYYARVLENPSCRWTTVLANGAGADLPEDVPAAVQERGWSSPIWVASP
ncbi:MAG: DUF3604 domain-containing protein [Pseudomonadales bacterium]